MKCLKGLPQARGAVAAVVLLLLGSVAHAGQITISVFASAGPNQFGSSSIDGYTANAIAGLEGQSGSTPPPSQGTPGTTTYYSTTNSISYNQMIATAYDSWMGQTPGPFTGENGNRLYFGIVIHADQSMGPNTFSLAQLNFSISSTVGGGMDLGNPLPNGDPPGSFDSSYDYSDFNGRIVGYNSITNTYITSGSADQAITDLFYVGVSTAFAPDDTESIATFLQNNPAALDPFTITGSYWLTNGDGGTGGDLTAHVSDTVSVNSVPEPTSCVLISVGLTCLGAYRLRRRRQAAA